MRCYKYLLFSFVLSFKVFNGLGQDAAKFELRIAFDPAFGNEITIETKRSANENLIILKKDSKICERKVLSEADAESIVTFLEKYDFKIKGSIDTVSSEKVLRKGDSVMVYNISYGSDGVNVAGSFKRKEQERKFAFWSPKKGTKDYDLVAMIFGISNRTFKKKKTLAQIETLQHYFE